jgi:hypothetical protein
MSFTQALPVGNPFLRGPKEAERADLWTFQNEPNGKIDIFDQIYSAILGKNIHVHYAMRPGSTPDRKWEPENNVR